VAEHQEWDKRFLDFAPLRFAPLGMTGWVMGEDGFKVDLCSFRQKDRGIPGSYGERVNNREPGIGNPWLKLRSALRRCSIELHKLLPQAKIIGMDLSSDMLEIAKWRLLRHFVPRNDG
jgi:hypothetical protein